MREIKFRAYSEQDAIMYRPLSLQVIAQLGHDFSDNIKLMQYTGLKDKNGVEIYEGDIIESIWNGRKYQIEWDESYGEWCFCSDTTGQSKYSESIVIGNIYENPELLRED